jgi:hypothetical protein
MDVVLFFYTSSGPQCSPSIILQGSKDPDFVYCTYYLHLLRVEQHYQTDFFFYRTGPLFRCQQRKNHVLRRKIKFYFLRASYSTSLLLLILVLIEAPGYVSLNFDQYGEIPFHKWSYIESSFRFGLRVFLKLKPLWSGGGHWLCKSSEISLTRNPSSTYRQLTPQLIYLHSPTNSSQQLNPSAGVKAFLKLIPLC